ncbi:uncharacterized protein LOC114939399 isoform X2 [Nylanderia fulva]|uniref:uncharacterized protein LOC114939399 isoform X2 n=1 Tax=Nylanderia fulva TaxID=613905 RepID=UPI0010FAE4A8|nr:uncharacterized protein LOC114939399 isoform X2 [Nylanderia fulva]
MATSSSVSNTWVLDYCTIENNKAKCDICSWNHNLIKQQLNQIKAHITSKHKEIYQSISSSLAISFSSTESTEVYTIKNYDVYCNFCNQIFFGDKTFRYMQNHITKTHTVEINKAKEIYKWLQQHFDENNMDAKSCRCYYCNDDIPIKPVFLMFHLIQVHAAKIPEAIRPTKLWECIANNNEWMWKFVTKYLLTKNEEHANCNICDKRLSITVDYATINCHIYNKHKTDYGKQISLQVLQEKNLFSIENEQAKCNKCSHICSIRYIDQNKELENHLSNEHKLDYAQMNNFVNWLKLYRNVIYFQTLECNACKNISNDNYFSLMRHFIEEHPIKFLLHLISRKLLDNLQILKIFNDAKDIAKPGGSNQQPRQNINQSSFKITSPSARQIIQSRYIMDTSSLEDSNWFLNFCTIENNMAMCDICSWKRNLIDEQLDQIKSHITSKHKKIYRSISSSSVISFRSYESTQVYAIKNNDVYCNFCEQIYFGENKTFRYVQKHITDIHIDGINKAKEICNWLQKHFGKNIVNAKSCCCNHCNNDIPNKLVFLIIHLEQVHDEIKIPEEIRPTGLWESTANRKEWMWKFVTKYLLTKNEEHANCNICDKRLSINVDYATIRHHIYDIHRTDHGKRFSLQVLQENNFFSIKNDQAKCNKCPHISSIRCIDQNKELQNHFSNEHKLDYAQINNFVNWLKLYQNVIYFQTLECNACKNISNDNYFSLMKHFIKEHPIKFLLHLISKKLLDNLQILKIFNDAKNIAKPGGSNQQPGQNINQSTSKITSPRLSDISEFKSSDNDIENVGTSAISSYEQPIPNIDQSFSNNTSTRLLNDNDLDISSDDNNVEDNATSSCQQPI